MSNQLNIKTINTISLVGIASEITNSQSENSRIISNLWKKFNREIHKIKNRKSSENNWVKYGITYLVDNSYHYFAGILFQEEMILPSSMIKRDILDGEYFSFLHKGKIDNITSTYFSIYKKILPENGYIYETPKNNVIVHFEKYDSRFNWNNADSILEVYISKDNFYKR